MNALKSISLDPIDVIYGVYLNRTAVDLAIAKLRDGGFDRSDISVVYSTSEFETPDRATLGAGTGAIMGGTLGWLAGIGALTLPVIGSLVAAGPIASMLTGVGVGGALGGLAGTMTGMGIPEREAKRVEGMVRSGWILISVSCDHPDSRERAKEILRETGATDVASNARGTTRV